jgi:hypothetical protein
VDTTLSDESVDIEKIVEEVVDNDTSKPKTKSKKQSKGKLVLKES